MSSAIRKIIGIIAALVGAALFLCLTVIAIFMYCNSPPIFSYDAAEGNDGLVIEQDNDQIRVRFEIRRGESALSVGQRLEAAGLIRSLSFWQLLCRYEKETIKTGAYQIEVPASQMAIHRILVSGKQMLLRVTIPEGLTLKKTAKLLEDAGICPADEFLAAALDPETAASYRIPGPGMEGYLYPDTYLFPPEYPAARVVRAMADNFFNRIGGIDEKAAAMPHDELNRLVILASIVEREYRIDDEAPVMAGVFFNRLNIGMALQSCATVEYIITEKQDKPHPEVLSSRDLEIRDPYNTYMRPGLPPGPISCPGAVALNAVFFPAKSNYLYFRLIDPCSGEHYFSATLDDHIKAGGLYVKGR